MLDRFGRTSIFSHFLGWGHNSHQSIIHPNMVACVELIAYSGTHSLHVHTAILDYFGNVFSRCSILIIFTSYFKSGLINQKNKALAKSLDASHLGKSFCTSSPIWNVGWFSPQKQYSYSLEGHGGRGWCKKNPQKTKVPGECLGPKFFSDFGNGVLKKEHCFTSVSVCGFNGVL